MEGYNMAGILNIGKREWQFKKDEEFLFPGKTRKMDAKEAKKWVTLYPKEFQLLEVEETKELVISDKVKELIKNTNGIGIKSAVKLFKESEAYDESLQIALIEEFPVKED
jgi:hypothetical protein